MKGQLSREGFPLPAESVAVSPDGFLYMLDKFGNVLKAKPGADTKPQRVTHLGPGRPLGFHFKPNGDLFICNAGTVSFPVLTLSRQEPLQILHPSP